MKERFNSLYRSDARVYRAPGRVNLIGEHTDYNEGFVMPAAIDLYTRVAIAPRGDRAIHAHSENFSETVEFDLDDPDPRATGHWGDYVRGVAVTIDRAGHRLRGANLLIRGEIPAGAGLSSSASLEVAVGYALMKNSGLEVDPSELAKLAQRAENEFVGARCGIMDQFIVTHGEPGRALLLDCRSLDHRSAPIPDHARLVICNTMVKHEIARGEYNTRRAECEEGVRYLSRKLPGITALRDVTQADLNRYGDHLPRVVYKRCRHVITENARVIAAAAALSEGDLMEFGRLMYKSHLSLREDYEVSSPELDTMVRLAGQADGVYGARMTGGGFGGCTINIVKADKVDDFKRVIATGYERATGIAPDIYSSTAVGGVEEIDAAE
ncbi:MAG TPA: galactokinase [Blastocatellia bacterium]|nr:galactokinase [Blastocatellia bacterium]